MHGRISASVRVGVCSGFVQQYSVNAVRILIGAHPNNNNT